MEKNIEIESYTAGDEEAIVALLTAAELPVEDLTAPKFEHFLVARRPNGEIIGTIGVEILDKVGLLRSLVIEPRYRRRGLGKLLIQHLEVYAHKMGVGTLYLLTASAPDLFAGLGYRATERFGVPEAVAATAEFKGLCPSTAVCLSKSIKLGSTRSV